MVTLAAAKAHCRVDFDDDDSVIEEMIAAASNHLESIGVDTTTAPVPPAVDHAILMLVAHFYEHREAVGDVETAAIQIGVDRLIQPYRSVHL
jgi:uncharacterized phage protein (predicted DNA packaging)